MLKRGGARTPASILEIFEKVVPETKQKWRWLRYD